MADTAAFSELLREAGAAFTRDEPMARHTTFRIGGAADFFATPRGEAELAAVLDAAERTGMPWMVLGGGSNLLVSDRGIDGAVISLAGLSGIRRENGTVTCGAGTRLGELCAFAERSGLSGMEFACGIPGTAGGAVFMNAGAYGREMRDVVVRARVTEPAGRVREIPADALGFAYRRSVLQGGSGIVTAVTVRLAPGDPTMIRSETAELLRQRKAKQPLEYPSAGSAFKRPPGGYAGTLIEQCGLKGYRVGGAQISRKHAGFIVNTGGATAADVLAVMAHAEEAVYARFGVSLEREIRFAGRA